LTPLLLKHRQDAVSCGLTTSHWPSVCASNHMALPEASYVCKFTNERSAHRGLSAEQRRLIGTAEQCRPDDDE
jgi:hypothetical protein